MHSIDSPRRPDNLRHSCRGYAGLGELSDDQVLALLVPTAQAVTTDRRSLPALLHLVAEIVHREDPAALVA